VHVEGLGKDDKGNVIKNGEMPKERIEQLKKRFMRPLVFDELSICH